MVKFPSRPLLPQPLLCIQDEPDPVQRQIQSGRCGVAGAVDRLGVLVTAEHLDGLVLDAFAMDLDDRVGALHADPVPTTRALGTDRSGPGTCDAPRHARWAWLRRLSPRPIGGPGRGSVKTRKSA